MGAVYKKFIKNYKPNSLFKNEKHFKTHCNGIEQFLQFIFVDTFVLGKAKDDIQGILSDKNWKYYSDENTIEKYKKYLNKKFSFIEFSEIDEYSDDEIQKFLEDKLVKAFFISFGCENIEKFLQSFIEYRKNTPHFYQRIIYGAPGSGKSKMLNDEANKFFDNQKKFKIIDPIERVTFYDGYTYGQFVGSYKPVREYVKNKKESVKKIQLSFEYVPGPLLRQLLQSYLNPENNFLLIIEELNRTKVERVFGDVFQLLDRNNIGESQYHISLSEDQKKFLKEKLEDNYEKIFKKDKLYFPDNFYIWCTMNSADQGVFHLDTAFKRRWNFEYVSLDHYENECENFVLKTNVVEIKWNLFRKIINNILLEISIPEDRLLAPFFIKQDDFKNNKKMYMEIFF
ncbi:MAG: AAA family ATPase [Fusobacteriaceae bacterium]